MKNNSLIYLIYFLTLSVFFIIFTPLSFHQFEFLLIQHLLFVHDDLFDDQFEVLFFSLLSLILKLILKFIYFHYLNSLKVNRK